MARWWLSGQRAGNDELAERTSWALIAICTAAVLVAFVLHVIQAAGLATGSAALAALPVAVAVIVAAGCWAALLRLLWRTRLDLKRLDLKQPAHAVAVVLSVVAICTGLESFAGLTTLLWQHGVIRPSMPGSPALWRCEAHYLWTLLGSVPLLAVPHTLGWSDPQPFADHIAGALLLAFKIAIIAPLVHLGLVAYPFLEDRRALAIAQFQREEHSREVKQRTRELFAGRTSPRRIIDFGQSFIDFLLPRRWLSPTRPRQAWVLFARLITTLTVAVAAAAAVSEPRSPVNRWLSGGLHNLSLSVGSMHLPLAWLQTVPQWLVLAGLIAIIWHAVTHLGLCYAEPSRLRTLAGATAAALVYVWLLALLTLTVAAASLALLHVGAVGARPAMPVGGQLLAGVNAYSWEMASSLPGPDIPATLNWSLHYRFTGHWADALLLLYKIGFLAVLLFPLYRIIREYTKYARPPADRETLLSAAGQFLDLLLAACAELGRVSSAAGSQPNPLAASPRSRTDGERVTSYSRHREIEAFKKAAKTIDELEPALGKVLTLFGDGAVADRATAARTAARDWHRASFIALPLGFPWAPAGRRYRRYIYPRFGGQYHIGPRPEPSDLAELQKTLQRSISEYSQSANQALRNAAVAFHSPDQPI